MRMDYTEVCQHLVISETRSLTAHARVPCATPKTDCEAPKRVFVGKNLSIFHERTFYTLLNGEQLPTSNLAN